jgi:hypothetical protein
MEVVRDSAPLRAREKSRRKWRGARRRDGDDSIAWGCPTGVLRHSYDPLPSAGDDRQGRHRPFGRLFYTFPCSGRRLVTTAVASGLMLAVRGVASSSASRARAFSSRVRRSRASRRHGSLRRCSRAPKPKPRVVFRRRSVRIQSPRLGGMLEDFVLRAVGFFRSCCRDFSVRGSKLGDRVVEQRPVAEVERGQRPPSCAG